MSFTKYALSAAALSMLLGTAAAAQTDEPRRPWAACTC